MLKLDNVDVYYGAIQALRDVSIKVNDGDIVALIGANGAGKTTTLKTVIGLLRPKKGKVFFKDEDVTHLPPHKRVKMGISIVPEGRRIFSRLSVLENLIIGAYTRKDEGIKEDLNFVMDLFPILKERKDQPAGTLSGGEQQMLAIARALMGKPELLLMDEPSLGLAPNLIIRIYETIREINKKGVTILLVEQNITMAQRVSNYVYILENGSIKMSGTPKEVISLEEVRKAYLGG